MKNREIDSCKALEIIDGLIYDPRYSSMKRLEEEMDILLRVYVTRKNLPGKCSVSRT